METLLTYLRETRTTPKAFAKLIGLDADRLERMLAGDEAVDQGVARRMVDATGGALLLEEISNAGELSVVDMRAEFVAVTAEIDADVLTVVLEKTLPALIGGARRKGDDCLPALAADAAVNTYAALSTITTRRGPDRMIQALRPVFAEILEDLSAPASARQRLEGAARKSAELYFQARPQKRRA